MKEKILLAAMAAAVAGQAMAFEYPLAPKNPTAVLSEDFMSVDLTWQSPGNKGENGGFIDESQLTYYIFDAFGSIYAPAIAQTTELSYTFDYSGREGQDFMAYQLTCGIGEAYSLPVNSNIVCVGAPAPLPFIEGFADGKQQWPWCIDPASGYDVTCKVQKETSALPAIDGDGGYLSMSTKKQGEKYGIISVKASLAGANKPVANLFCCGSKAKVDVLASADGITWTSLGTAEPESGSEWGEWEFPLQDYAGDGYVQIELMCSFSASTSVLKIDRISIFDAEPVGTPAIAADSADAPVEYFTIDGRPARADALAPGLYIRRQGANASKVLIR